MSKDEGPCKRQQTSGGQENEGALGLQKGGTRVLIFVCLFSKDCILKDGCLNVCVNYLASEPRTGW